MQKDKKQILGADGKTLVWVFDGDVNYQPCTTGVNYCYYKDKDGKRWKTTAYSQYSAIKQRTCSGSATVKYRPNYYGVTLSEEFSTFDKWMDWALQQAGFMNVCESGRLWQMDKDILCEGRKTYCPNTCRFIPQWLNTGIGLFHKYEQGVKVELFRRVFTELFDVLDEDVLDALIDMASFDYTLVKQGRMQESEYLELQAKHEERKSVRNNLLYINTWDDIGNPMSNIEFRKGFYYVNISRNGKKLSIGKFKSIKEAVYEKIRCRRLLCEMLEEEFSFSEFFYSENFDKLIFEKREELDELEYLLGNNKIALKQYVQIDVF